MFLGTNFVISLLISEKHVAIQEVKNMYLNYGGKPYIQG